MINHGTTYSHNEPKPVEVNNSKIFIASNIEKRLVADENNNQIEQYSYNLTEYTVAEYLTFITKQYEDLKNEIANIEATIYNFHKS